MDKGTSITRSAGILSAPLTLSLNGINLIILNPRLA